MGQVYESITPALQGSSRSSPCISSAPPRRRATSTCRPRRRSARSPSSAPRGWPISIASAAASRRPRTCRPTGASASCSARSAPAPTSFGCRARHASCGDVPSSPTSRGISTRVLFATPGHRRSIVVADLDRISDSCGDGVPIMTFERDRDTCDRVGRGPTTQVPRGWPTTWRRRTRPTSTGSRAYRPDAELPARARGGASSSRAPDKVMAAAVPSVGENYHVDGADITIAAGAPHIHVRFTVPAVQDAVETRSLVTPAWWHATPWLTSRSPAACGCCAANAGAGCRCSYLP